MEIAVDPPWLQLLAVLTAAVSIAMLLRNA
jgi:hypothetical protein